MKSKLHQQENGNGGETIVASMTQEAQSLGLSPDQVDDHVQHIAFTLLTGKFLSVLILGVNVPY